MLREVDPAGCIGFALPVQALDEGDIMHYILAAYVGARSRRIRTLGEFVAMFPEGQQPTDWSQVRPGYYPVLLSRPAPLCVG